MRHNNLEASYPRVRRFLFLVCLSLAFASCGGDSRAGGVSARSQERYTGDYGEILSRGTIRFLAPLALGTQGLPRARTPLHAERRLAEFFAYATDLEPEWVWVEEYADLIPALQEGRGDVIVANYTVTPERQAAIDFSPAFARVREVIVTHPDSAPITTPGDLVGRTVSVRRSSAFWPTMDSLVREFPGITLTPASESDDTEELLYAVATGKQDVTVADDLLVEVVRAYLPGLRVDIALGGDRDLAWGVRKENTALRDRIAEFMRALSPEAGRPDRYVGDLPAIKERKVLRVLTRNNPTSYFVWRGHLLGFEHDLVVELAKSLDVNVEFVVAPNRPSLYAWLLDGYGDLVAAGVTLPDTASRMMAYSHSYNRVVETVVTDSADHALDSIEDLAGRSLALRVSSAYWETAQRLRKQGIDFDIVHVPEEMETAEILERVATGEYDVTIADSHILDMELTWRDDIRRAFAVSDTVDHGWIVRPGDRELLGAVNAYLDSVVNGEFYRATKQKYFGSPQSSRTYVTGRAERTGILSPYDDLTRRYSDRYDFDWIMVTAQMYEESRFDPEVVSFAGAVGLMQLMPATARGFGFDSLTTPEVSIHAGTRYMRHVYYLLDDVPDPNERLWFTLASYNAGLGHIKDARRLAEEHGLDPNVWFENVAVVAPLLQRRAIHRQFQYGYCRCNEPVAYVRKIRNRYRAYSAAEAR